MASRLVSTLARAVSSQPSGSRLFSTASRPLFSAVESSSSSKASQQLYAAAASAEASESERRKIFDTYVYGTGSENDSLEALLNGRTILHSREVSPQEIKQHFGSFAPDEQEFFARMYEIEQETVEGLPSDPSFAPEENSDLSHFAERYLMEDENVQTEAFLTKKTTKVLKGGRIQSTATLVVVGNMNGVGGYGYGKHLNPGRAATYALTAAKRNLIGINLFNKRTINSECIGKSIRTRVTLKPARGMVAHPVIEQICHLMGVKALYADIHGNRDIFNIVRATFNALARDESATDYATKLGLNAKLLK